MHEEVKRPASSFRNASPGHVIVFVDENGNPGLKDENGDVRSVSFRGGFVPNWKGGIVGNPYVAGDTVNNFEVGQVVMAQVGAPDVMTIEFPQADEASAGKELRIVNLNDSKLLTSGTPQLTPASGDRIGSGAVDEVVIPYQEELFGTLTFISDGNGWWHHSSIGGDAFVTPIP
jgi:hypothetical protein